MNSILHIYGQEAWHDDVNIYGNRKALEDLRDALITLLKTTEWSNKMPKSVFIKSFVNDGEEFTLFFNLKKDKEMDKLIVPYTDEIAKDKLNEKESK